MSSDLGGYVSLNVHKLGQTEDYPSIRNDMVPHDHRYLLQTREVASPLVILWPCSRAAQFLLLL